MKLIPFPPFAAAMAALFLALGLGLATQLVAQERPPTPTEAIISCWMNTVEAGKECLEDAMERAEKNLFLGLGAGALCGVQYALDVFLCVPARLVSLVT
jgi:hypothetical protein